MRFRRAVAVLTLLSACIIGATTEPTADLTKSKGDAQKSNEQNWVRRTDAAMDHWREDRFGIMIHWGLYAIPGGVWKGKTITGAAEWIKAFAHIPNNEYENLATEFNPIRYDPVAWARQFKQAGARYVVITTKHHDGFCMFDSKYTDYDCVHTPYGKDILKPFVEALRAQGIDVGLYYSIIDWHHPDYRAAIKSKQDEEAYARYITYMKNQLRELLTNYGPIMTLWFDGRWDASYKNNPQIGKDLEAYCRSLMPGIVLGDRVRAYDSIADYNSGFERKLPRTQPVTDWECCMTMTENSWGYHSSWTGNGWKTPKDFCELLTHCASMNGNFLCNIGPRADGTIRPEETLRLQRIGDWMGINGQAICGSTACPVADLPDGVYTTRRANHVYVLIFRWPDTDKLKLKGLKIESVNAMAEGISKPLTIEDGDTLVGLPIDPPNPIGSVYDLTVSAGPATAP